MPFAHDSAMLDRYCRQITPDAGPLDPALNANAVTALVEKMGPGILVTHSHSGGMGSRVATRTSNVRTRLVMARRWRNVVNRHGGDATVVHLREVGLPGTRTLLSPI